MKTNWLHGKTVWKTLNTLDLDGEDLIDDAKLAHLIEKNESPSGTQRWVSSLSLNGRDLTESRLAGADLRHVDFSNTILNRADFPNAWVTNAHFDGATLRGTFFQGAHLQGAKLDQAELQGTAFYRADLKGASLYQAQLQGAFLAQANLQGAEFGGAELQGASLNGAQLQGATLEGALLQGANLDGVHLQGANLDHAELQGAWLVNAFVWRADARKANWKGAFIAGPHPQPATLCDPGNACNWTAHTLKKIEQRIADEVPEGNNRSDAIKKIKPRLDPDKVMEGEKEMAKFWAAREHEAIDLQVYEKSVAEQWRNIGCAAEGAPYVLRQLLDRLHEDRPFEEDSLEEPKLAAAFLAKDCIGAHGLSQDEIAKLKKVAAPAATQPPKP